MEKEKVKSGLTKTAMWLVKNHWLVLVLILGLQYLSGEAIGEEQGWLRVTSYENWLTIHKINGELILIVTAWLAIVKGYLWLLRSRRL